MKHRIPKPRGHGDYFEQERGDGPPEEADIGTSASHTPPPDQRPEEPAGEVPDGSGGDVERP